LRLVDEPGLFRTSACYCFFLTFTTWRASPFVRPPSLGKNLVFSSGALFFFFYRVGNEGWRSFFFLCNRGFHLLARTWIHVSLSVEPGCPSFFFVSQYNRLTRSFFPPIVEMRFQILLFEKADLFPSIALMRSSFPFLVGFALSVVRPPFFC